MGRIRTIATVSAAALVIATAAQADRLVRLNDYLAIIVPAASPVRYSAFSEEELTATFTGTLTLSGKFTIGYVPENPKEGDKEYFPIWFVPDGRSASNLPHWKSYHQRAIEIVFDNPEAFAKAVLTTNELSALKRGSAETFHGHATIKADHYRMNITCDTPYYTVRFLSVVTRPQELALQKEITDDGC